MLSFLLVAACSSIYTLPHYPTLTPETYDDDAQLAEEERLLADEASQLKLGLPEEDETYDML